MTVSTPIAPPFPQVLRGPERIALACTVDSEWRNRAEFVRGCEEIKSLLRRQWAKDWTTVSFSERRVL
jgi:nuclear transport factor 2 (NTF2) superfamily protein